MEWRTVAVTISLLCGVSCAGRDRNRELQAVKATVDEWYRAFLARDVDGQVKVFAEDGIEIQSGAPPLRGKAAIRRDILAGIHDPLLALTYNITALDVSSSGDFAYVWGPYRSAATSPVTHRAVQDHGSFLLVLRKQSTGRWKLILSSDTSEATPSEEAPPSVIPQH